MKKFCGVAIMLFVFSIFMPVVGQASFENIKPYGNLYMFLGYNSSETYTDTEQKEKDSDLLYNINEYSNLGFDFKYAQYRGVFELGIGNIEDSQKVVIRKAFGEYSFGDAKLLVGQNWSPYTDGGFSNESANYYRSKGFGGMYEDPTLQIKLSIAGLYVNIMKPYVPYKEYYIQTDVETPDSATTTTNEYSVETVQREITTKQKLKSIQAIIPKLGVGYSYGKKGELLYFNIGAAGNAYKVEPDGDIEYDKNWIISYLAYLNCEVKAGSFMFKLSGGYAVNPANFGIYVQSKGNDIYAGGAAPAIFNFATGKYEIKDTWNVQAYAQIGFELSKGTIVHAGYGYSMVKYPVENSKNDQAMEYFANIEFKIGDMISLTPSFSYRDYQKDMADRKEGYDLYAGILATVSF